MKSNPINSITVKYERTLKELQTTQSQLKQLREDHGKLIKDSIQVENSYEKMKNAVSTFCEDCTLRGNGVCATCVIHEVAIEFKLWGDLV